MELARLIESGLVATSFFSDDVENNWLILFLQIFKAFDERGKVVTVNRAVVAHAKFFEENVGQDHILGVTFDLLSKLTGAWTCHLFHE